MQRFASLAAPRLRVAWAPAPAHLGATARALTPAARRGAATATPDDAAAPPPGSSAVAATYAASPRSPRRPFQPSFSPCDRLAATLGSAVVAFLDPARADAVALLGEVTGGPALVRMRDRMAATPSGAAILAERPRIRSSAVDLAGLRALPAGTFGAAYAAYCDAHGFNADERHEVKAVENPELAYVLQRYREVHDFWHVLSGLPPSLLGETAVKWLELVQTGLPMTAAAALVGPLRLSSSDRALLRRVYIPWAVRVGRQAVDLLSVRYEDWLWDAKTGAPVGVPLSDVYAALRFEPAPPL